MAIISCAVVALVPLVLYDAEGYNAASILKGGSHDPSALTIYLRSDARN